MQEISTAGFRLTSAHLFACAFLLSCALGAVLIGSFPLQLSIVTIFLFAGPHNLMEFRYFASRMPVRWGRSKAFYAVGIGGVVLLTIAYLTLYFASGNWLWSAESWQIYAAIWNTAFIMWLGLLFHMRGKQRRKDWSIAFAVALLLAAIAWMVPQYWSLALVFLHPLVALWFLERQIRRTRREWLRAYHLCLASIPVFLIFIWAATAGEPRLTEESNLFWRIVQHAGGDMLPGISSHLLVSTHVFLESIHYFVWLLIIPLVDRRALPWRMSDVPLFAGKGGFPKLFAGLLVVGAVVTVALWFGSAVDYTTTRDIYFAFAIGHVLAEMPFLVKML